MKLEIQMTDEDVVKRAHVLSQARGKVYRRLYKRTDGCTRKPIWRFCVYGKQAEELFSVLRPWMGERRGAKMDELLAMKGLSHHKAD